MSNPFFERPILNSPYEYPNRHWRLDETGQPTGEEVPHRRRAEFITPIPQAKKQGKQQALELDSSGLSDARQQYEKTAAMINEVRAAVDAWRALKDPAQWLV